MNKFSLFFRRAAVLCFAAALLTACGSKVELMSSLPENEANEVLAVLLNSGIKVDKIPGKEGNVSLTVEGSQVARAIDILHDQGLPRETYVGMGAVFKKEGLISSPLEEKARYIYALSQELSDTLSRIDGVITARVHVVLPERGSGGEPNQPSSAAVFIKYQEGANIDLVQAQIKRLIANSAPGLTPDKVSIILVAAQPGLQLGTKKASGISKILGMNVASNSATTLIVVLATLFILLIAALAGIGWLVWKYMFSKRVVNPASKSLMPSSYGGSSASANTGSTGPTGSSAVSSADNLSNPDANNSDET